MSTTLMRGPKTVRDALSTFLSTAVPAQIAIARAQWNLDERSLPEPSRYDAYEPYALDEYPLMGIVITNASNFRLNDIDAYAQRQYRATYAVRLFTWVRTPLDYDGDNLDENGAASHATTLRLRDDLSACVRAALLGTSSLGSDYLMWDEGSLSEEYSDATGIKGDRFIAGVTHIFNVQVDESLYLPPIGMDNETLIDAMTINEQVALVAEESP